ncbi:uncharacterized protein LODBEIA_P55080 [Lodderomyces beijingensis]|uniref:Uncharacterized protein n=1 Tax=Lodderomyces beijingensis TaxID=1775926 RepID=A0ABP0ZTR5_9ASCO
MMEVSDIKPQTNPNILHEVILNKFNRTTSGRIYEKDLKDIFAMLIISLDLKKDSMPETSGKDANSSRIKFMQFSKKYAYSFLLSTAIEKMSHLKIEIESSKTVTSISYNFKPEVALSLIIQFYRAKLLHSPADRTREEPKPVVALQPTPKGLSIVQAFCVKQGLKKANLPDILLQPEFNSMRLFNFERDPISDKVVYSKSLVHLLFGRLLGPRPNIWSPTNKPDKVHVQKEGYFECEKFESQPGDFASLSESDSSSNGSGSGSGFGLGPDKGFSFSSYQKSSSDFDSEPRSTSVSTEEILSPFHHRYFENPKSDAHMQYYVSSVGVRLMRDKILVAHGQTEYHVSGKAICQWLMDCSDIVSSKQASEIASLFLKHGLFTPDNFDEKDGVSVFSRERYYKVTSRGLQISQWGKRSQERMLKPRQVYSNGNLKSQKSDLSLLEILKDPGTKMQFRKHLENEFCLENFDAYCQLEMFSSKMQPLLGLIGHAGEGNSDSKDELNQQLLDQQKACLSMAYQIFNTYINSESLRAVNIDYKLRTRIMNLLTKLSYNKEALEYESLSKYMKTPTEIYSVDFTPVPDSESESESESKHESTHEREQPSSYIEPSTLETLLEISELFEQVRKHMYKLMEINSVPKFLSNLNPRM